VPHYCVNENPLPVSGHHEVHDVTSAEGCLPGFDHRRGLGWHPDCTSAVAAARRYFEAVRGCVDCAADCHTT
jgi:hypothetical protein